MLDRQVAESFVELLSNQTDSLSTIYSKFHSSFDVRNRMVALTGISMLLSDGLLEHPHQIVATWLLFREFNKVPIHDSPFLPVFVHLFNEVRITNPNFCPPQLYDIVSCILDNGDTDAIDNLTLKAILSPNFSIPNSTNINLSAPKAYQARISPVLSKEIEKTENGNINSNSSNSNLNALGSHSTSNSNLERVVMTPSQILVELLSDPTIYNDFEPPYVRPAPEITPIFPGEVQQTFISSFDTAPALFDEYVSLNSKEAAVSLIRKAIDNPLKPAEIDSLSRELKKNPELSSEADMTSSQIEMLIENNPPIAQEIVLYLVKKNDKLLDQLASVALTQSKAKVIKEILVNPDLQAAQFENYIYKAMNTIKTINNNENYLKSVSLFCQMLCEAFWEGKRFGVDLLVELYSFCVEPKNESLKESQELASLLSA
ncbi:hypothetical protein TRFO_03487 [Tritrichomonas foetus]|uniref:CCR4-NOT transcription complex subunit 11 n=1 Tax=Tritrichomonas foetus TaxID=1144522 RepID=A0A1J4KTS5_9EUKA|nr:hypothetical protein TRFO_03487 [Tritrichomonas foetus]|eukprot:OHT13062.1 hypothetical protein TRFO_03487 [Tritrichomonas foetus]